MSEQSKADRAAQLATATPKDKKPKWYHYVFLVAAGALVVGSFFDSGDNHLRLIALVPLALLLGCMWWNDRVNGSAFDDRAGKH